MKDKVSFQRIQDLHPKIREAVVAAINEAENNLISAEAVRIVQGYRSFEEQAVLYAKGRTTPGPKVTKSKPGQSFHQYRLAIDFAILRDKDGNGSFEELSWDMTLDLDKDGMKDWIEIASTFERHGFEWGGRWKSFKDFPHCQMVFGYTWQQLLKKYNAKDFIPGTNYINI